MRHRHWKRSAAAFALAALFALNASPQSQQKWTASWITHPTIPLREPAVLHFRREFQLAVKPSQYTVHVSADNRFILYVNGHRIGDGPARGDLAHWRYETFDLARYLIQGSNYVTATVWNYGIYAPVAQITDRTAFLLQCDGASDGDLSTPKDWMVEVEPGQKPVPRERGGGNEYMANGPGEELDAAKYDWNWNKAEPTGGAWVTAASPMRENIYPSAAHAGLSGQQVDNYWQLIADDLPHMEYTPTDAGRVVRSDEAHATAFPSAPVELPANGHVHILFDRKTLTTGYPQLAVSGGAGASIKLTYAEALYDDKHHKGDRDEVGTRLAYGFSDIFLPDGKAHRTFEPLWWRTWRYLDLDIQTGASPLTLESLTAQFTAYPFEERASFEGKIGAVNDADLAKIWEVSWRTARLDAHETYMDTPYWEQLQYVGDTRIQALISYSVGGDDRLAKQALQAFDESRIPEGLTQSRYPTSQPQMIPPFSLLWVSMLHDYYMYRPDTAVVKEHLPGTRTVLDWFARYERPDGLLTKLPWWSFVDWVVGGELPNYDADGESCTTTLQYLGALQDAAEMEQSLGDVTRGAGYVSRAQRVRSGLRDKCRDTARGLVADNPDRKKFSQQTNVLAVLFDVVPRDEQPGVLKKVMDIEPGTHPDGVLGSSYYFRFYLARALEHAGMGDDYLASLKPWRDLLPMHFSTWPEIPGDTRSDSHAWSAHPAYDLLTLVAGIGPSAPGFATVQVAPHMGELTSIAANFPHPMGTITVRFERKGEAIRGSIGLPVGLNGTFVWKGKTTTLHQGVNHLSVD